MFQGSSENAGENGAVRGYLSARMQCQGRWTLYLIINSWHVSCNNYVELCGYVITSSSVFTAISVNIISSLMFILAATLRIFKGRLSGQGIIWPPEINVLMLISIECYQPKRMCWTGNLWQELWASSRPVPALKQSPLFDEELAGYVALYKSVARAVWNCLERFTTVALIVFCMIFYSGMQLCANMSIVFTYLWCPFWLGLKQW